MSTTLIATPLYDAILRGERAAPRIKWDGAAPSIRCGGGFTGHVLGQRVEIFINQRGNRAGHSCTVRAWLNGRIVIDNIGRGEALLAAARQQLVLEAARIKQAEGSTT